VPNSREKALAIAAILLAHGGGDVVLLDLSVQAGWTDWFVIATATSSTHLRGLARFVDEGVASLGLSRLNQSRIDDEDEWLLVDLGDIVIHLMTERTRAFYELEKLWFQCEAIRPSVQGATQGSPEGAAPPALPASVK
jgi:ribosome-associated protein